MILLGVAGEATLPTVNRGQFWHCEHEILPGVAGEEATLPAVNRGQFWHHEHEILPGVASVLQSGPVRS